MNFSPKKIDRPNGQAYRKLNSTYFYQELSVLIYIKSCLLKSDHVTFDFISLLANREAAVMVAEWLRRWTRNPMGSPRTGSNPVYDA